MFVHRLLILPRFVPEKYGLVLYGLMYVVIDTTRFISRIGYDRQSRGARVSPSLCQMPMKICLMTKPHRSLLVFPINYAVWAAV